MPIINDISLNLTLDDAFQFLGARCHGLVRSKSVDVIKLLLDEITTQPILQPKISYTRVPVEAISNGRIYVPGGKCLSSAIGAHRLKKATHLLLGVCTLGDRVESAISQYFNKKQRFKAVMMGELANLALFSLSEKLQSLADAAAEDMGISASGPLSPGDDGFALTSQELVIDLAGAEVIGVSSTSTQMMTPHHSLSVVYGLGNRMPRWSQAENCEGCRARERCRHRLAIGETR